EYLYLTRGYHSLHKLPYFANAFFGLMNEVLKDKPFFEQSNGGITLSGGEPALHHRFLKGFLELCHKEHIHTAIETCGYFSMLIMRDIFHLTDLILYDIKIFDEAKHINFTGRTNRIIFENLKALASTDLKVVPRMPIIPGYTAYEENIVSIARMIKSSGFKTMYLLPYHSMGEAKIKPVGSTQPYLKLSPLSMEQLHEIQAIFSANGIETILYGWM
ncbi:MAG: radical SAM protein, partial [bacterium]